TPRSVHDFLPRLSHFWSDGAENAPMRGFPEIRPRCRRACDEGAFGQCWVALGRGGGVAARGVPASQRSFPVIGLLSSRPTFGRSDPAAKSGSSATDGRPSKQALTDFAVAGWRSNSISSRDGQLVALVDPRVFPPAAGLDGRARR